MQQDGENTNETIGEEELIHNGKDIDIKLWEIKDNGDNFKKLTLLSLEDVTSDNANWREI